MKTFVIINKSTNIIFKVHAFSANQIGYKEGYIVREFNL